MKTIILIIALLVSANAFSCEKSLVINLGSHHSSGEFNEKNYGAGFSCKYENILYGVGFYDNSYYKTSYYASVGAETSGLIRAGVSLMAVSGYKDFIENANRVSVIALPEVSINYDLYKLSVGYLPGIEDGPSVTTLRAGIKF